jgi:hypothetical protein
LFGRYSAQMVPQLHRSEGLGILSDLERSAIEKVFLSFLLI